MNWFMDKAALHLNEWPFICANCKKEYKSKTTYLWYVIYEDKPTVMWCNECISKTLKFKSKDWRFIDWRLYYKRSTINHWWRSCAFCWAIFFPKEWSQLIKVEAHWSPLNPYDTCPKCLHNKRSWVHYCFNCWCVHEEQWCNKTKLRHNFRSSYWSWSLNFIWHKEYKSWNNNWQEVFLSSDSSPIKEEMKKLPFQTQRDLPEDIIEDIDDFYWSYFLEDHNLDHYTTEYNFWEDLDVKWDVDIKTWSIEKTLKDAIFKESRQWDTFRESDIKLKWYKDSDLSTWLKQNKYRSMYFDKIDDEWYVVWKYIDMFWNIREKKESINVFYKAQWLWEIKEQWAIQITYRMSTDIRHKAEAFLRNDEWDFNSCQRSSNSSSYAKWAYDTITNWCICPILIYKRNNMEIAVWRITARIMYDKEWTEYILIERLYHDWTFSNQELRWEVYKWIVLDLRSKWYKVIVSNYSAHDESTLVYLQTLWLTECWTVLELFQPLRQLMIYDIDDNLMNKRRWYYADWWTECYTTEINWIRWSTDHLDKWYLI